MNNLFLKELTKWKGLGSAFSLGAILGSLGLLAIQSLRKEEEEKFELTPMLSPFDMGDIPFVPLMDAGMNMNASMYVIRVVSPDGQHIIDVVFTQDEWDMLHQVVEMSGEPLDQVLSDVILERKYNGLL